MRDISDKLQTSAGRYDARLVWENGELSGDAIKSIAVTASINGSTDRLTLGATPAAQLTASVVTDEKLLNKRVQLFLSRGGGEISIGVYTITSAPAADGVVTLTGYDAMYTAMEKGYYPTISDATTARAVLDDVAKAAGLELVLPDGLDAPVSGVQTGSTLREMAGYMAALLGCSARIDGTGALRVQWFTDSGVTLDGERIYSGGASLAGEDWVLSKLTCSVATRKTTTDADGITTQEDTITTLTSGEGATGVSISNAFMTQSLLDELYQRIGGFAYRAGELSALGDLRLEPGDLVTVESGSERVVLPIMSQTLEYDGGLKMTLSACAESESDGGGEGVSGPLTQAVERYAAELAVIRQLDAENAKITKAQITDLKAGKAEIGDLTAATARIDQLDADKLSVKDAEVKYANIDFSNIDQASIEHLYATSGIIKDLTIDGATITGELVGVTIKGDLIEGGTVVADKLVVQGEDGLYYKLNTDGVSITAEQTEYNSLNGSVITAKSVTAEKISVSDLVAFGADIGGFHITTDAIYSGVKASADNTARGVYLDSGGQLCVGDGTSFLRYRMEEDGSYKLELVIASNGLTIDSDNFKLTADGTVTAAAGEIGGFQLKTELVNGLNRHYLFGGHEQDGKQYGLRLQPSGGTDEWDSQIRFANGGSGVTLEAERYDTGEGIRKLNIYGAPVNAVSGLMIGSESVEDFVTVSGTSGGWEYIKYASGLAMMWCNVTAEYSAASVLEKWVSYPFTLQAGVAAFGTLEGVGSNAGAALGWNVKIVPQSDNKNARVFVHNPSGSFGGADALTVAVLVLGRWK